MKKRQPIYVHLIFSLLWFFIILLIIYINYSTETRYNPATGFNDLAATPRGGFFYFIFYMLSKSIGGYFLIINIIQAFFLYILIRTKEIKTPEQSGIQSLSYLVAIGSFFANTFLWFGFGFCPPWATSC